MKLAIITSGVAPVPATKGGAVENLIQHLINENEKSKDIKIEVYSIYESEANELAQYYKNTTIKYISSSKVAKWLDNLIYIVIAKILKKNNNMKYRNLVKRFEYIFKVKRYLYSNEYDKVVLQNHPTLFLALKGKNERKYHGKYYIHFHNEINSIYGCERVVNECKKIIGVSQYICNSVKEYFPNHPKKAYEVLYNCIDLEKFNKSCLNYDDKYLLRKKYDLEKSDVVAIFSGRLVKEKGIIETIQAFKIANSSYPELKLLIVGGYFYNTDMTSSELNKIKDMTVGMENKIKFTGYINYEDIPKIYAMSDFAILPSMWEEPAGLTLIEAMASSLPIITTDSGGIPEYVSDKCAFILERNEDLIDNIVRSIEMLVNNKELRKKMGEEGEKQSKRYNIRDYYKNFIDILEKEEW